MSKPAWLIDRSKEINYNAKLAIAKDAYHASCWVYSERTKKLYTPREFMDSTEKVNFIRGFEETGVYKVVDPRKWYYLILDNIKNQTEEVLKLQKRIDEYYEMTPKPKNKKPKFNV